MIKGARQVGKTYLVREFGKNEYESFIEINFIKNPNLKDIFSGDIDAENIYKRMSFNIEGAKLIPHKTLIFLDEIQVCGRARKSAEMTHVHAVRARNIKNVAEKMHKVLYRLEK